VETPIGDGILLWEPSEELKQQATLARYMQWLEREKGLRFSDQEALWAWSVNHLEDFWASTWEFFAVKASRPYARLLADRNMPGARWFAGAEFNYAEQVFRNATPDHPTLLFQSEGTNFRRFHGKRYRDRSGQPPMRCVLQESSREIGSWPTCPIFQRR
jgi:acetoacetyl-CoA synthetase